MKKIKIKKNLTYKCTNINTNKNTIQINMKHNFLSLYLYNKIIKNLIKLKKNNIKYHY